MPFQKASTASLHERKRQHPNLTKLGSDMAVPDDKLDWVMKLYEDTLMQTGLEALKFGHIGDNHLHVNILPRNEAEYTQGKQVFEQWHEKSSPLGDVLRRSMGLVNSSMLCLLSSMTRRL